MIRDESEDHGADGAANMTPPSTGNAEDAGEVETPELTPNVAPMNWLSEFAGLIFGSCTPKDVQEAAQALDIQDTAARGLHIETPDLEGGKLLEADPAKCVLYFESLCSLFKLEVNTGDVSKMSLALAEWPMSRPPSAGTIKIGRVWKGIIMGQVYTAKNKAKIPRHVSIPLLNRISKYSEGGWKKACCLEAHDKLKPPQALRNDSGFIMPYRLEHYLGQKQVLSEDVERALKDRDRHAKLPLHQLMTARGDRRGYRQAQTGSCRRG